MEYIFGRRNGVQSTGFEFYDYFVGLSIWCFGSFYGSTNGLIVWFIPTY